MYAYKRNVLHVIFLEFHFPLTHVLTFSFQVYIIHTYCFWYLYLHIYFCNRYNIILARNFSFPKKENRKYLSWFSHSTYAIIIAPDNNFLQYTTNI